MTKKPMHIGLHKSFFANMLVEAIQTRLTKNRVIGLTSNGIVANALNIIVLGISFSNN